MRLPSTPSQLSPAARILRQLSPLVIAEPLGVTSRMVRYYQDGRHSPGPRVRQRAACLLGIPEALWEPPPDTLEERLTARVTAIVRAELEAVRGAALGRVQRAQ